MDGRMAAVEAHHKNVVDWSHRLFFKNVDFSAVTKNDYKAFNEPLSHYIDVLLLFFVFLLVEREFL